MGLLDDAIREHLELKRRAGADPNEVARQEQEALGPARRGPEPLEVTHPEVEEPAAVDPHAPEVDAEVPEFEPGGHAPEPEPHVEPEPEPQAEWHAPEPEPAHEPAPPEPEPEAPHEPEAAAESLYEAPPTADQPTVAFDAADVEEAQRRTEPPAPAEPGAPESPESDEDVLEETPDFLQETPEHDRLWFEQRPPRDFDFDG
jgi:hypothetical protein